MWPSIMVLARDLYFGRVVFNSERMENSEAIFVDDGHFIFSIDDSK